jgi:hypothetical protein
LVAHLDFSRHIQHHHVATAGAAGGERNWRKRYPKLSDVFTQSSSLENEDVCGVLYFGHRWTIGSTSVKQALAIPIRRVCEAVCAVSIEA